MGRMYSDHDRRQAIEIEPPPDLYAVEFEFPRHHLGVSVIVAATCALSAKLTAWELFPEHKRSAISTHVSRVRYVEIDWQSGRTVVKKKERPEIPFLEPEDFELPDMWDKRDEEGNE